MRVILTKSIIDMRLLIPVQPEAVIFDCNEDFSEGPVADWRDPEAFRKSRDAWWLRADQLQMYLEDGGMPVWFQCWPALDFGSAKTEEDFARLFAELEENGPREWGVEEALAQATRVELWVTETVQDQIWRLWVLTELRRLQVGRVHEAVLPEFFVSSNEETVEDGVKAMLAGQGPWALTEVSQDQWDLACALWQARCERPGELPPEDLGQADAPLQRAMLAMASRVPDLETGLDARGREMVLWMKHGWNRVLRVISEPMIQGLDKGDGANPDAMEIALLDMAERPEPLAEIRPKPLDHDAPQTGVHMGDVRLTKAGEALQAQLAQARRQGA